MNEFGTFGWSGGLLYNTLMTLCLQYKEVNEKADTASKKKLYQNYRKKTLEIIRQIEKQRG